VGTQRISLAVPSGNGRFPLATSLTSRFIGKGKLVAIRKGNRASVNATAVASVRSAGSSSMRRTGTVSMQAVRTEQKRPRSAGFNSYFGRWELAPTEGCVVHHLDTRLKAARATEKQYYWPQSRVPAPMPAKRELPSSGNTCHRLRSRHSLRSITCEVIIQLRAKVIAFGSLECKPAITNLAKEFRAEPDVNRQRLRREWIQ